MSDNLAPYGIEPVEEWPDLVPLDTPTLPRIDLGHLPGWAGEYARALSESTETPPELAAGMILATCATAAARRLEVRVKPDHCEPCNLWVVVALPPGNRKSAIQAATTRPLIVWEKQAAAELQPEIKRISSERQTLEVRIKYLRVQAGKEKDARKAGEMKEEIADLEASLPELPTIPQLWTSDATPERLGTLLSHHGECMAWLSSEGGVFDLLQGRYSNGIPNLDLVLKAHSGDAERVDRGSRPPVFLHRPRLTIGLSPQPDVLRGLASKPGFRGRGLLGRFLYLLPPSPLGFRTLESNPVPVSIRESYDAGVRAMLDWPVVEDAEGETFPQSLELSAAAYEEWHAFARQVEMRMRPGVSLNTSRTGRVRPPVRRRASRVCSMG